MQIVNPVVSLFRPSNHMPRLDCPSVSAEKGMIRNFLQFNRRPIKARVQKLSHRISTGTLVNRTAPIGYPRTGT